MIQNPLQHKSTEDSSGAQGVCFYSLNALLVIQLIWAHHAPLEGLVSKTIFGTSVLISLWEMTNVSLGIATLSMKFPVYKAEYGTEPDKDGDIPVIFRQGLLCSSSNSTYISLQNDPFLFGLYLLTPPSSQAPGSPRAPCNHICR